MNLIYRAQNFEYVSAPVKLTAPRIINWRYQFPGMTYGYIQSLRRSTQQPRAVNWRYQLP